MDSSIINLYDILLNVLLLPYNKVGGEDDNELKFHLQDHIERSERYN